MTTGLRTTEVGVIYFRLYMPEGVKWYVCSSLTLSMQLNSMPVASVVIGCGKSIRYGSLDDSDNNAEDILTYVMDAKHNDTDSFLECDIVESMQGAKEKYPADITILFKGCVVAASLAYKTGDTTIRAVRVECMNNACRLYAQPLNAYNNTVGSYIVEALTYKAGRDRTPDKAKTIREYGMYSVGAITSKDVCTWTKDITQHKDIATKIAYIADAITLFSTKTVDTTDVDATLRKLQAGILGIRKYIKSDYFLNYEELSANDVLDSKFDESICSILLNGLRSSSIYDTILRAIVSPEFMLTMVPKWGNENYMMSIEPSHAWESKPALQLKFSQIAEFNSSYKPFDHINDPEVFAVNFDSAINFAGTQGQAGEPAAIMGAYSTNDTVAEWIKMRFSEDPGEDTLRQKLVGDLTNFKWTIYSAPTWLRVSFVIPRKKKDGAQSDIKEQRTQAEETSTEEKQEENSDTAINYDYQKAHEIADKVAKAIYVHLHGESATAQLKLLPSMRFGMTTEALEDHIGEIIDIVPEEESDQHLAMRGMLEAIQFNYSAGKAASCNYTVLLSRVRPLNQQADDIKSPVYVSSN